MMRSMSSLEVRGDEFVLDGESCTVLSGAIHYFRVVPEYWEDRLCSFETRRIWDREKEVIHGIEGCPNNCQQKGEVLL